MAQADSQGLPDDANDSQLEEGELPIGSKKGAVPRLWTYQRKRDAN